MRIPCCLTMVSRSSIISIGLISLILLVFPVSGYIFDFEEGTGPGWIYEGDKRWYRTSDGHNSNYSMKSGDIDCSGTSSIYRYVEGNGKEPIEISFWWKKGGTAITNFTFSVDGRLERTCRSYKWDVERFTIPEDDEMHEIRWDFEKQTCHLQGYGRVDDVSIKSTSYKEAHRAEIKDFGWKGEWNNSAAYAELDIVTHNGSSYVCIQNHSDKEPPSDTYWELLAKKGDGSAVDKQILLSINETISSINDTLLGIRKDASYACGVLNFTDVRIEPKQIYMCNNSNLFICLEFLSFQEISKVHSLIVETPDVIQLVRVVNSSGFLENVTLKSGNIYESSPISSSKQGSLDILYKISSEAAAGKYFINVTKFEAETKTGQLIRGDLDYSTIIIPEKFDMDYMECISTDRWDRVNRDYQSCCEFIC